MWPKQLQIFQLSRSTSITLDSLTEQLGSLAFHPCLPSMPLSVGWAPVLDEEGAPLVRAMNHYLLFSMQIEEKILPATVVRQAVNEKIKEIETIENRKVRGKEKYSLKEETTITLLPQAFSRFSRVYAYIDLKERLLMLGTTNAAKTEQFMNIFKKAVGIEVTSLNLKKCATIMTHWLKEKDYPSSFSIEKACVLQDPDQQNRVIRCQQQDLFSRSIQPLIKEGFEVKQIAMNWYDKVNLVLVDDFTLRSIQFSDEVKDQTDELEPESKLQQLDADFLIFSATLSEVLRELMAVFLKQEATHSKEQEMATVDV
ncbi:MAG: recombination-associated protein RdgC [Gammaproteobacteria bacterium]